MKSTAFLYHADEDYEETGRHVGGMQGWTEGWTQAWY